MCTVCFFFCRNGSQFFITFAPTPHLNGFVLATRFLSLTQHLCLFVFLVCLFVPFPSLFFLLVYFLVFSSRSNLSLLSFPSKSFSLFCLFVSVFSQDSVSVCLSVCFIPLGGTLSLVVSFRVLTYLTCLRNKQRGKITNGLFRISSSQIVERSKKTNSGHLACLP